MPLSAVWDVGTFLILKKSKLKGEVDLNEKVSIGFINCFYFITLS
jgi:hypothetical protein